MKNDSSSHFKEEIEKSLEVLRSGGIIIYPTDTIWGIGCDATHSNAVEKVYSIKNRTLTKSLLVLVDSTDMLAHYVPEIPEKVKDILHQSTYPTTIIYPRAKNLAGNIIADDGSVGIRIVDDEFCKQLISRYQVPIVSTSANFSGENPPSVFAEINGELLKKADYVVKWRQEDSSKGTPSAILKLEKDGNITKIR